jgi:LysR family transcriptional regulator, nitrogen assimilation regulatory protein
MLSVSLARRIQESGADIRLDLTEAPTKYLSEWVADGEIDLAVACEGPVRSTVRREVVLEESLYLVQPAGPGEPALGAPIDFTDLADMPLLVADPLLTRMLVDKLQQEATIAGIRLYIRSVMPSMNIVKNLVEDGEGATVLPYAVVKRECEQRRLRVRKIVGPTLTRNAYMLSHVEKPQASGVCQLVRDVISDQIRGTPEHGKIAEAV